MRIIAKHFTSDFRGDHATDVCRMVEILPSETVEELIDRLMPLHKNRDHPFSVFFEKVEIQRVYKGGD